MKKLNWLKVMCLSVMIFNVVWGVLCLVTLNPYALFGTPNLIVAAVLFYQYKKFSVLKDWYK